MYSLTEQFHGRRLSLTWKDVMRSVIVVESISPISMPVLKMYNRADERLQHERHSLPEFYTSLMVPSAMTLTDDSQT
jgi:hypothetical protein